MPSAPRTVTVDDPLLRGMARDAAFVSLTRPTAIVMWGALLGALVLSILNLSTRTAAGPEAVGSAAWLPPAIVGVLLFAVIMTNATTRRAVRASMPPGTTVAIALQDDGLRIRSGERRSSIDYRTFQSLRAGRDAVVLKIRDEAVLTALPRALFTDADLVVLRERIAR
ncbi:YcxB family protein [Microbacterium sp. 179-I 3D4 NHS]|uniref:YcxB family protein n=1 Tax=Microbacterium sp. 179-I 3D4 NHS TaxID=3142381 RepID=UPI0039A0DE69